MGEYISRQDAIDAINEVYCHIEMIKKRPVNKTEQAIYLDMIGAVKSLPSAQQWIPIKTRPMTDEEKDYYSDVLGVDQEYYGGYMFDCQMPEDGQRVWVQTKNGYIYDDVCERDDFFGLEGNGDWDEIVAWMPMFVPDQWKGE